jgi:secondary thiamine-phosphate synthase enzyme
MSVETIVVRTQQKSELIDISRQVQDLVSAIDVAEGTVTLFVPHTTAGITLNENADPNVRRDMLADLERLFPDDQPYYRHAEGNSAAHMKASLMGSSVNVIIEKGRLVLGTWQGIYLCEFDGPRTRKVHMIVGTGRGA